VFQDDCNREVIRKSNLWEGMMSVKSILTFLCCLTLITLPSFAAAKRYDVKSGVVEYAISSSGTVEGSGSSKLQFKDYGDLEINSQTLTTSMMGMKDTTRDLSKLENGVIYSVDFDEQVIVVINPETLQEAYGQDMGQVGLEMLEAMGAEKTGTEKVLGYRCDLWTAQGSSFWLYKGVPLKIVVSTMGMTQTSVATSAKFDVSLSNSEFVLPDYPHKTLEQMMEGGMQEEMQGMSDEEKVQMQEAMDMMKNMFDSGN
jgi:hypothetical protein